MEPASRFMKMDRAAVTFQAPVTYHVEAGNRSVSTIKPEGYFHVGTAGGSSVLLS